MASRLPPLQANWSNTARRTPGADTQVSSSPSSRMLIDRADSLKDSIVQHMMEDDGYGTWHDRRLRALYQDHLQTVTTALKKLGYEIESLESQLSGRQQQTSLMNSNIVRSLEVQQATSVGDLRSRVARCDGAIAVLSGDMRKLFDSMSALTLQLQSVVANQSKMEKTLEEKISNVGENSERHRSDYSARLRSSEDKFQQALSTLDTKLKNLIEETQRAVESIRMKGESSHVKLEREFTTTLATAKSKRDQKIDDLEQTIKKRLVGIENRLETLEADQKVRQSATSKELYELRRSFETARNNDQLQHDRMMRTMFGEFQKENSEGLEALRDSLTSLRAVLEGKQVLLADELRAEISKMKKLVVVT